MPSKIEYCDETLEVTGGCTKCSPGCRLCWAVKEVWRMAHNPLLGEKWQGLVEKKDGVLNWTGKIKCFEDALQIKRKKPTTYFVDSKADLFHPKVPMEYQLKVFEAISNASQHTYLIFTKRMVEMKDFFQLCEDWDPSEWPNVQFMLSISTQKEADEKIPIFLQIPGFHGLSIEPMLEEIKLHNWWLFDKSCYIAGKNKGVDFKDKLDWIVVGGESGPKRRPCKIEWVEAIVDQCKAASVPVFVKQINVNGKVVKMPKDYPQELPERR